MELKNLKIREERIKNIKATRYCSKCNRIIASWNKTGICSFCQNRGFWKEVFEKKIKEYEDKIKDLEKKLKLSDIAIKSFMKELRKYKPIEIGLDN